MEDIFAIQDEIARGITERFKVTFGSSARRSTTNVEAYELYLKGRHLWHPALAGDIAGCYQELRAGDSARSRVRSGILGLADSYGILQFYGWMPARDAMMQAVRLAPDLWEVHFSRAFYSIYFERTWHDSGSHF